MSIRSVGVRTDSLLHRLRSRLVHRFPVPRKRHHPAHPCHSPRPPQQSHRLLRPTRRARPPKRSLQKTPSRPHCRRSLPRFPIRLHAPQNLRRQLRSPHLHPQRPLQNFRAPANENCMASRHRSRFPSPPRPRPPHNSPRHLSLSKRPSPSRSSRATRPPTLPSPATALSHPRKSRSPSIPSPHASSLRTPPRPSRLVRHPPLRRKLLRSPLRRRPRHPPPPSPPRPPPPRPLLRLPLQWLPGAKPHHTPTHIPRSHPKAPRLFLAAADPAMKFCMM